MKIGLVCPYIYPEAGGVAQHVRFLYENLRLSGHDVRIITASHGPQRSSEGDILRIGVGFSMPTNGSVGTLTFSPRYITQVQRLLDRERFDLLHFHEPFVPFLSLFLLRESTSVNIATFHAYAGFSPSYELGSRMMRGHASRLHGRIAVSAAARHFIDRFFPGDYKVIPNGVDVAAFRQRRADRPLAGRHAEHPVRRTARTAQGVARPAQGPADPAQDRLRDPVAHRRVRPAGTRGAPLRGDPRPAGCGVPWPGDRGGEGPALPDGDVFATPATGGESFGIVLLEAMAAGAPIVASDIHGYKGVVRRGREGLLVPPRDPKALAIAIARLLDEPDLRAEMSANGRLRAEAFSWPRVTAKVEEYYGFVIRRLATAGHLPEGYRAPIPQAPATPGEAVGILGDAAESRSTASESLQTQAE